MEGRGHVRWGDLCVAVVLAGLAVVEIWVQPVFQTGLPGPPVAMTVIALLTTMPVAVRATHPLSAGALVLAGLLLAGLVGDPEQAGFELFLSLGLVTWAVSTRVAGGDATRVLAVLLLGAAVYEALTFVETDVAADLVVPVVFLLAVWTAGSEVRRLRDRARAVTDRAALVVEEQDGRRERAIQDERDRIARELHDVVASALSIVGVQAAAASTSIPADDTRSRRAVETIERVSRDAVLEMQRMLQVLRAGDDPAVLPTGLDALPGLVRDSGLDVELVTEGELAALSSGLQLTVLRIVQEALTNVRKHSGTDRCRVGVTVGPVLVDVVVTDDGTGPGGPVLAGHGLVGMSERARLVGGSLEATAAAGRGFTVRARLPRLS